jgi:hypothetical protein
MIATVLHCTRAVVATLVILAVPAFALWSLVNGSATYGTELARADDPIRNGLRIVEPPVAAVVTARTSREDAAEEIVLNNWNFTGKGKPSPYK